MRRICSICGSTKYSLQEVQYVYRRDGKLLVVNNVPCEVCNECKEQYFEASVLKRIESDFEQIYVYKRKPGKEVSVPVGEFAEIP